jgi:hypothetical protein
MTDNFLILDSPGDVTRRFANCRQGAIYLDGDLWRIASTRLPILDVFQVRFSGVLLHSSQCELLFSNEKFKALWATFNSPTVWLFSTQGYPRVPIELGGLQPPPSNVLRIKAPISELSANDFDEISAYKPTPEAKLPRSAIYGPLPVLTSLGILLEVAKGDSEALWREKWPKQKWRDLLEIKTPEDVEDHIQTELKTIGASFPAIDSVERFIANPTFDGAIELYPVIKELLAQFRPN